MFLAKVSYRSQQFFGGFSVRIQPEEHSLVSSYLTPEGQSLFYTMTRRDQRHSLDILVDLRGSGFNDTALLTAALLHDVGKGNVRMWHRALYVLLQATSPKLTARLAHSEGDGWRSALARLLDHAERSATLATAVGASEEAVEMIRRHHERESEEASPLWSLQKADERC